MFLVGKPVSSLSNGSHDRTARSFSVRNDDAVISDIHRNSLRLMSSRRHRLPASGPDCEPRRHPFRRPIPRETADRLMIMGLPTIRGNHDRQRSDQPRERMGLSDRHAFDQPGAEQLAFNKRRHNPCGFTADLSRTRILRSRAAFCPSTFDLEECAGIAVEATTDIGAFSTSRAAL